ncbi:MAG: urease accessory protein [Thiomonas sp. 15-66-11]|jgi:urease accessory protein|nr:MAG: urease accessory protein [Thiomonas sp. 15-66-11]
MRAPPAFPTCLPPRQTPPGTAVSPPLAPQPAWASTLHLRYGRRHGRSTAHSRHAGALRVLAALHPEGPDICHHVLVHPPGGLVGGDRLDIRCDVEAQAHALVTTPGATRFYRSLGAPAVQTLDATLHEGTRLEWLPLETLAYNACLGENRSRFTLAPGAELFAWDMLALGLPAAGQAFQSGRFTQHLELPGVWLERGHLDATDAALLHSPSGLAGRTALGTLVFASGSPIAAPRRDALLDAARQLACGDAERPAGATSPHPQVVVLRAASHRIEPLAALFKQVWAAWRHLAWDLPPCAPRVWAT